MAADCPISVTFTVPLKGHMVRIGLAVNSFILFRAMLGGLSSKEVPEQFDALSHTESSQKLSHTTLLEQRAAFKSYAF